MLNQFKQHTKRTDHLSRTAHADGFFTLSLPFSAAPLYFPRAPRAANTRDVYTRLAPRQHYTHYTAPFTHAHLLFTAFGLNSPHAVDLFSARPARYSRVYMVLLLHYAPAALLPHYRMTPGSPTRDCCRGTEPL